RVARQMLPSGRAGEWNQALMDLSASLCTARASRCLLCPIQPGCQARGDSTLRLARSAPNQPFKETARYFRGRLLAALRDRGPQTMTYLGLIASDLAARGVAEPKLGWPSLA